jgi:hypothetical protein
MPCDCRLRFRPLRFSKSILAIVESRSQVEIDLQGIFRFPVYAGFTSGLDDIGLGLLGQSGFFDRFNVHFKLAERIYEIETI